MTSKFSRSLIPKLLAPWLACSLLLATAAAAETEQAQLRFWNLLGDEDGELQILRETGAGQPECILEASPSYHAPGYVPAAPGRCALRLVRRDQPEKTLKRMELTLAPRHFLSLLAERKESDISITLVDDTSRSRKAASGALTVRHLMPGASIRILAQGEVVAGPLEHGSASEMGPFPLLPLLLTIEARTGGRVLTWDMEADFTHCPHATLLLSLDPYKRFRPRIVPDGQLDFNAPDTGETKAQGAAPSTTAP